VRDAKKKLRKPELVREDIGVARLPAVIVPSKPKSEPEATERVEVRVPKPEKPSGNLERMPRVLPAPEKPRGNLVTIPEKPKERREGPPHIVVTSPNISSKPKIIEHAERTAVAAVKSISSHPTISKPTTSPVTVANKPVKSQKTTPKPTKKPMPSKKVLPSKGGKYSVGKYQTLEEYAQHLREKYPELAKKARSVYELIDLVEKEASKHIRVTHYKSNLKPWEEAEKKYAEKHGEEALEKLKLENKLARGEKLTEEEAKRLKELQMKEVLEGKSESKARRQYLEEKYAKELEKAKEEAKKKVKEESFVTIASQKEVAEKPKSRIPVSKKLGEVVREARAVSAVTPMSEVVYERKTMQIPHTSVSEKLSSIIKQEKEQYYEEPVSETGIITLIKKKRGEPSPGIRETEYTPTTGVISPSIQGLTMGEAPPKTPLTELAKESKVVVVSQETVKKEEPGTEDQSTRLYKELKELGGLEGLRREIEQYGSEKEQYERELKEYEWKLKQFEDLSSPLASYASEIEELNKRISEYEKKRKKVEELVKKWNEWVKAYNEALKQGKKPPPKPEGLPDWRTLTSMISELKSEYMKLQIQYDTIQYKYRGYNFPKLEEMHKELQKMHEKLSGKYEELSKKSSKLERLAEFVRTDEFKKMYREEAVSSILEKPTLTPADVLKGIAAGFARVPTFGLSDLFMRTETEKKLESALQTYTSFITPEEVLEGLRVSNVNLFEGWKFELGESLKGSWDWLRKLLGLPTYEEALVQTAEYPFYKQHPQALREMAAIELSKLGGEILGMITIPKALEKLGSLASKASTKLIQTQLETEMEIERLLSKGEKVPFKTWLKYGAAKYGKEVLMPFEWFTESISVPAVKELKEVKVKGKPGEIKIKLKTRTRPLGKGEEKLIEVIKKGRAVGFTSKEAVTGEGARFEGAKLLQRYSGELTQTLGMRKGPFEVYKSSSRLISGLGTPPPEFSVQALKLGDLLIAKASKYAPEELALSFEAGGLKTSWGIERSIIEELVSKGKTTVRAEVKSPFSIRMKGAKVLYEVPERLKAQVMGGTQALAPTILREAPESVLASSPIMGLTSRIRIPVMPSLRLPVSPVEVPRFEAIEPPTISSLPKVPSLYEAPALPKSAPKIAPLKIAVPKSPKSSREKSSSKTKYRESPVIRVQRKEKGKGVLLETPALPDLIREPAVPVPERPESERTPSKEKIITPLLPGIEERIEPVPFFRFIRRPRTRKTPRPELIIFETPVIGRERKIPPLPKISPITIPEISPSITTTPSISETVKPAVRPREAQKVEQPTLSELETISLPDIDILERPKRIPKPRWPFFRQGGMVKIRAFGPRWWYAYTRKNPIAGVTVAKWDLSKLIPSLKKSRKKKRKRRGKKRGGKK